jgi:hypothetical protein
MTLYFVQSPELTIQPIVTAASSNHFLPLLGLLNSIDKFQTDTQVIVYDIGLTSTELAKLRPWLHKRGTNPFAIINFTNQDIYFAHSIFPSILPMLI